eukprot:403372958
MNETNNNNFNESYKIQAKEQRYLGLLDFIGGLLGLFSKLNGKSCGTPLDTKKEVKAINSTVGNVVTHLSFLNILKMDAGFTGYFTFNYTISTDYAGINQEFTLNITVNSDPSCVLVDSTGVDGDCQEVSLEFDVLTVSQSFKFQFHLGSGNPIILSQIHWSDYKTKKCDSYSLTVDESDPNFNVQQLNSATGTYQLIFNNTGQTLQAGNYDFTIFYKSQASLVYQNKTINVEVVEVPKNIQQYFIDINSPPYFLNFKDTIRLKIPIKYEFSLPKIIDNENDEFFVQISNLPKFANFETTQRKLIILATQESNVGNYSVQITLKDNRTNPGTAVYLLIIQIYQDKVETKLEETFANPITQMSMDFYNWLVTLDKNFKKLSDTKKYKQLNVEISSIDRNGILTLNFDQDIAYLPFLQEEFQLRKRRYLKDGSNNQNYKLLNYTVLEIKCVPEQDQVCKSKNLTWKTITFTENKIQIQLSFSDPLMISYQVNFSMLKIVNYNRLQIRLV